MRVGEPETREGVWGHVGAWAAEGMFDRGGMTSGGIHRPGHCTHQKVRELRWSGFRGREPESMFGSGQNSCPLKLTAALQYTQKLQLGCGGQGWRRVVCLVGKVTVLA